MPYLTFNGMKYHYSAKLPADSSVPKQAVVFVHGSGGSHRIWQNQINFLGRNLLAVAVDLPGHGLSEGKPSDNIADYSEFMYTFAERLFGIPFFLAGHSMGGAVALDFALNNPEKLAGLILIGTGSRLRVLPSLLETLKSGSIPENLASFMYKPETPESILKAARQDMTSTDPFVFYSDMTACDRFDSSGRLSEIETPALIITGDKDVMTPVKYGKHLNDNLKRAEFAVVEEAGHMSMLEQPGRVNSLIYNFIIKNCQ